MKVRNLKGLLLLVTLLICTMMFAACGKGGTKDEGKTATYKVAVVDALGNRYTSGVIAKFLKGNEEFAMQVCDENGVATKELDKGEYNIEVSFTDGDENYSYNKEGLKVTADKNEIEVVVAYRQTENNSPLFVGNKEYEAYAVKRGCTEITLNDGRNYFLFTPTEAGTYEFSIPEGKVDTIGYYGAPHYIQQLSAAEVKDNKFTVSVRADMISTENTGTTVIVIGVDKADDDSCVLGIERIGDPEYSIVDEPWTIYQPSVVLNNYTLPEGAKLAEFDITKDSYELVLNEEDGFYHLNSADGPLVLMNLGKDNKYLACFKNILDKSGVIKYFFEEDGTFIKKESYSECLLEYIKYIDKESGTYPLTEDLKYIVTQRGDHEGWFDPNGNTYLFKDEEGFNIQGINNEISWLFMCSYIEE